MILNKNWREQQIKRSDFLRIHMLPDKDGAGHGAKNHANKTLPDLISRIFIPEKGKTTREAASGFRTYETYQRVIQDALLLHDDDIETFLRNAPDGETLRVNYKIPDKKDWSDIVYRNNEKHTLEAGKTNTLRVILLKDSARDLGFFVKTAYAGPKGVTDRILDLTKEMKQSDVYQKMPAIVKPCILRMAKPDPDYELRQIGENVLSMTQKETGLRADITPAKTALCVTDNNKKPKSYGLRPDKAQPWIRLESVTLQKYLQDNHPQFYQNLLEAEKCYLDHLPPGHRVPLINTNKKPKPLTNYEMAEQKYQCLTDIYAKEHDGNQGMG